MNSPSKASKSPDSTKEHGVAEIVQLLKRDFPHISFVSSDTFRWSYSTQSVHYNAHSKDPTWSLLHEVGHMVCDHQHYSSDVSLIRMELEAWESAKKLARTYGRMIDEDHIQDCMDSYRNWLHKRSSCPVCTQNGIETHNGDYRCFNCQHTWHVSSSRLCRVYRMSQQTS